MNAIDQWVPEDYVIDPNPSRIEFVYPDRGTRERALQPKISRGTQTLAARGYGEPRRGQEDVEPPPYSRNPPRRRQERDVEEIEERRPSAPRLHPLDEVLQESEEYRYHTRRMEDSQRAEQAVRQRVQNWYADMEGRVGRGWHNFVARQEREAEVPHPHPSRARRMMTRLYTWITAIMIGIILHAPMGGLAQTTTTRMAAKAAIMGLANTMWAGPAYGVPSPDYGTHEHHGAAPAAFDHPPAHPAAIFSNVGFLTNSPRTTHAIIRIDLKELTDQRREDCETMQEAVKQLQAWRQWSKGTDKGGWKHARDGDRDRFKIVKKTSMLQLRECWETQRGLQDLMEIEAVFPNAVIKDMMSRNVHFERLIRPSRSTDADLPQRQELERRDKRAIGVIIIIAMAISAVIGGTVYYWYSKDQAEAESELEAIAEEARQRVDSNSRFERLHAGVTMASIDNTRMMAEEMVIMHNATLEDRIRHEHDLIYSLNAQLLDARREENRNIRGIITSVIQTGKTHLGLLERTNMQSLQDAIHGDARDRNPRPMATSIAQLAQVPMSIVRAGTAILFIMHIPMADPEGTFNLIKYEDFPVMPDPTKPTFLHLHTHKPYVALNDGNTVGRAYTKDELDTCYRLEAFHICYNMVPVINVQRLDEVLPGDRCALALRLNRFDLTDGCTVTTSTPFNKVTQVGPTRFRVATENRTSMTVSCRNRPHAFTVPINYIAEVDLKDLGDGCTASTGVYTFKDAAGESHNRVAYTKHIPFSSDYTNMLTEALSGVKGSWNDTVARHLKDSYHDIASKEKELERVLYFGHKRHEMELRDIKRFVKHTNFHYPIVGGSVAAFLLLAILTTLLCYKTGAIRRERNQARQNAFLMQKEMAMNMRGLQERRAAQEPLELI